MVSLRTFALMVGLLAVSSMAQQPQRTRLILRDGSYQLVLDYRVTGDVVRFHSAERNGEVEEIPLKLVDLTATERWKREHTPGQQPATVLSPELAKEEADRAARTPEVANDLRLAEEDSVLALDVFQGTNELVPLRQQGGSLDPETAHDVLKTEVNPASSAHRLTDIPGERADVQFHVAQPVFFVRLGRDDVDEASGTGMVVDTHGLSSRKGAATGDANSTYAVERIDVRLGQRRVDTFRIGQLGTGKPQRDVIELKHEELPGGHWLKLTPVEPLLFGEYALVEIVDDHSLNAQVWDFGVHPDAKENTEALRPELHREPSLGHR